MNSSDKHKQQLIVLSCDRCHCLALLVNNILFSRLFLVAALIRYVHVIHSTTVPRAIPPKNPFVVVSLSACGLTKIGITAFLCFCCLVYEIDYCDKNFIGNSWLLSLLVFVVHVIFPIIIIVWKPRIVVRVRGWRQRFADFN